MMNYRLTFWGLTGFDMKGFDTKEEAIEWAKAEGKLGCITPDKLMKYNSQQDCYKVIGEFKRA